jgi:60 kDa SS-A/Ro ribonucleoprotein
MARINIKQNAPRIFTHEGGPAKHITDEQRLRRLVLPCLLWEDNFYVDGKTIAEQIAEAVRSVPGTTAAAVAIEAREQFHLRHVPLWIVRQMAKIHTGSSLVSSTLARVIQRPDELGEFVSIYYQDQGATKHNFGKGQPLSAQVKKGLARAFTKFDAYQLAKYAQGGGVRLRDVMFMTHPRANGFGAPSADAAKLTETRRRLASDDLGASDAVSKFADTSGTWESNLSQVPAEKSKAEVWTDQLKSIGYLALLRNLRNMQEAGVDRNLVNEAIIARRGARQVLPFRYIAAARAAPRFEPAIDQALVEAISELPSLGGKGQTWVLVDVSGSMEQKLSAKSDLTRMDAAAALASIIPGDVRVFTFSDALCEVPPRRGMAGVDAIIKSQPHGGTYLGTAVGRLNAGMSNNGMGSPDDHRFIVITDEQTADRVPPPYARRSYMINVASHQNGVGYGSGWLCHIDGFSEAVLRFIQEMERPQDDDRKRAKASRD